MTTVGYGDKAPKSVVARLFATVWMISGIILLSMFTAQVTSRLTTEELKNEYHIFGKKIGVPYGFEISDYVEDVLQNSIIKDYRSTSEYVKDLTDHKLDSAVVFHCEDNKVDNTFEILQFLETCQVGAVMYISDSAYIYHGMDKTYAEYSKCMKVQTKAFTTSPERNKGHKETRGRSCKKLFSQQEDTVLSFKWVYFADFPEYLLPLGAVIAAVLLTFIIGSIWDSFQRKKRENATGAPIQTRSKKSSMEEKKSMISDEHQLEMQSA